MRQAVYTPHLGSPCLGHIHCNNENQLLQSIPSTWYWTLISIMSLLVGQDSLDVGQSIADLGETGKSQEQVQAVGKTRDREGHGDIPTGAWCTDGSSQGSLSTWTAATIPT